MKPLLVLEDTTRPSLRLFSVLGVEWWATRWAWVGPLFWIALGILLAWADGSAGRLGGPAVAAVREAAGAQTALRGVGYGILLWLTNAIHTLGHVGAGALAGSRMDAVVLTSTRDVDVYRGAKRSVPECVRALRSLGGPAANAIVAVLALAARAMTQSAPGASGWLRALGLFNAAVALWTLMPVPTMDGWIIWRALLYRRKGG